MNITFTEPIAEHDEIVAAVGGALARLNGLAIVRGLLDGNDAAARAADGALLEFGLSELAAGRDPASRQSAKRELAAIFEALGAQLVAVRYLAAVVHANLRAGSTSATRLQRGREASPSGTTRPRRLFGRPTRASLRCAATATRRSSMARSLASSAAFLREASSYPSTTRGSQCCFGSDRMAVFFGLVRPCAQA
jgi:hypothetical protein